MTRASRVFVRALSIAAASTALSSSGGALAQTQTTTPALSAGGPSAPLPAEHYRLQATIGVRSALIRSSGYDPFATDDGLTQFALDASVVALRAGRTAFAVGAGLDAGSTSATARGDDSDLRLTHFSLLAELRVELHPRVYLFGRLAPGLVHASASLHDLSTPGGGPLVDRFNLLALDASAGGAVRLSPANSIVGFFLVAEGGYELTGSHDLQLAADLGPADQSKAGVLDFGDFSARGMFMRFALALAY